MQPVDTLLREPRARSTVDLALSCAVEALNDAGHHLVIDAEFSLGSSRGVVLPLPTGQPAAAADNWLHGVPGACGPSIDPLWGAPDYIVRDAGDGNRIVMVVEAKRFGLMNLNAEAQLDKEMLGGAAANYWGTPAALPAAAAAVRLAFLRSVSDPLPTAGADQHVAGLLSDGYRCRSVLLCGDKLNDPGVQRLPFANLVRKAPQRVVPRPPNRAVVFPALVSCAIHGLVRALYGNPCLRG